MSEKVCVLLSLDGYSLYMLGPFVLKCSSGPVFSYWLSVWMIHSLLKVGSWNLLLPLCCWFFFSFSVQFSHSVVSDSLWPYELQHARPSCPSPTPWVHPNPCSSSQWCHPTISSSVIPFSSCPQSFPASVSFPMSQLFASGGQSIGASASALVLPVNIQDWFSLGWTGWISLQSKGLSRGFSNTTVQRHKFFSTQYFYGSILTSLHDYWKNHSFDYLNPCWQSIVSVV